MRTVSWHRSWYLGKMCGYCMCVTSWATLLLTPTRWRGQGVLRISSTGLWACPHAWLNLCTGNTSCPSRHRLGWDLLGCNVSHDWQRHRQREVSDHNPLAGILHGHNQTLQLIPHICPSMDVCVWVCVSVPGICRTPVCACLCMQSVQRQISRQQGSHKSPL